MGQTSPAYTDRKILPELVHFVQIQTMTPINHKTVAAALAMRSSAIALVAALSGQLVIAAETTIYKEIDHEGATLFTDKPSGHSTTVTLPEPNIVKIPTSKAQATVANEGIDVDLNSEHSNQYALTVTSIEINNPKNEQTFINPQAPIPIDIESAPATEMPEGYSIQVAMDEKIIKPDENAPLSIPAPERGAHTLEAMVLDPNGAVVATSQKVTIYVKRSFIQRGGLESAPH